jgi:c(7)-type cytochrome triheme protein
MNSLTLVMAVLISGFFVGNALAVPSGKTAEWDTPMGKVVFDGKIHADKGVKCTECHVKIFKMKKGSTEMKMADINAGKFCGECHNGSRAFATKEPANCGKCHKK